MQEIIKVNQDVAKQVLEKIDQILEESVGAVTRAERGFMSLAFLLTEAKRGAYWTTRGYKSEHEYIEKIFPQSRAQYYRLVKIGTNLQSYDRKLIEGIGSSKAEDLTRLHIHFDGKIPEEWIEHARVDDKNAFRRRIRSYLNKKDEVQNPAQEDSFITFRIFGDGIHVVNMALETMARSSGSEKGLGYCLELICANYLSQFAEDNTGHVIGKNSFILATIGNLVQQLDFSQVNTSEMLIGIIAAGIEKNVGTKDT